MFREEKLHFLQTYCRRKDSAMTATRQLIEQVQNSSYPDITTLWVFTPYSPANNLAASVLRTLLPPSASAA